MTAKKKASSRETSGEQGNYWEKKQELEKKKRKLFNQRFFHDWCKSCGICIAFCPKKIITTDRNGKPVIEDPDQCTGCRFCELHCPDFAISINERYPDRRRKNHEG
jgi:2-oxoglutarate ferredoxin oxidoreductase subunit delta